MGLLLIELFAIGLLAGYLAGGLEVSRNGTSSLVAIAFLSEDPALSRDVVNKLMDARMRASRDSACGPAASRVAPNNFCKASDAIYTRGLKSISRVPGGGASTPRMVMRSLIAILLSRLRLTRKTPCRLAVSSPVRAQAAPWITICASRSRNEFAPPDPQATRRPFLSAIGGYPGCTMCLRHCARRAAREIGVWRPSG